VVDWISKVSGLSKVEDSVIGGRKLSVLFLHDSRYRMKCIRPTCGIPKLASVHLSSLGLGTTDDISVCCIRASH
jgi:hypothetical protein